MTFDLDAIGQEGLRFYGKISASISHEMKNVLAVLNENAGLLEDLVLMSKKGVSLNTERIESLAGSIKKQIQRGDLIAKNLNRFGHSVDDLFKTIDAGEILELTVSLTRRFADMKGVTLDLRSTPKTVEISTSPFLLEHLVWCCLEMAIMNAGKEKSIGIDINKSEKGVNIHISGFTELSSSFAETFPGARENDLLNALNAQMEFGATFNQIQIMLPKTVEA